MLTKQYWLRSLDKECYQSWHLALALGLGVPGLLVFSVGFPATIAALLVARRRRLHKRSTQLVLGFMYQEYVPHLCFWECVLMLFKFALTCVAVYLNKYGASVQLPTAAILAVSMLLAHTIAEPYRRPLLNTLQRWALFSYALCLLLLAYLTNVEWSEKGRTAAGAVSGALVLATTTAFLAVLGWAVCRWLGVVLDTNGDGRFTRDDARTWAARLRARSARAWGALMRRQLRRRH